MVQHQLEMFTPCKQLPDIFFLSWPLTKFSGPPFDLNMYITSSKVLFRSLISHEPLNSAGTKPVSVVMPVLIRWLRLKEVEILPRSYSYLVSESKLQPIVSESQAPAALSECQSLMSSP